MNADGLIAASFALGLGAQWFFMKIGDGVVGVMEMMDSNSSVVSDANSSIVDVNTTIDLNSTIDANASMVVSVLNQLSSLV